MPVHSFTKWHKWQPRIPVYADWNAIPIEEIIHNWRQTFFHFFDSFSTILERAKKALVPAKTAWLRHRNHHQAFAVIRRAVEKKGHGHDEGSGAAENLLAGQGRDSRSMGAYFHAFVAQGRLIVGRWGRESSHDTAWRAAVSWRKGSICQAQGSMRPLSSMTWASWVTGRPTTVLHEPSTRSTSTAPCPWMAYAPALSCGSPVSR